MFKHLTIILTILVSLSPALASEPMAVGELADDSYSEAGEARGQTAKFHYDNRYELPPSLTVNRPNNMPVTNRGAMPAGAIVVFHSENCPPEWAAATWLGYSSVPDASGLITCEKQP